MACFSLRLGSSSFPRSGLSPQNLLVPNKSFVRVSFRPFGLKLSAASDTLLACYTSCRALQPPVERQTSRTLKISLPFKVSPLHYCFGLSVLLQERERERKIYIIDFYLGREQIQTPTIQILNWRISTQLCAFYKEGVLTDQYCGMGTGGRRRGSDHVGMYKKT